ncbi:2-amino-4-oxopentanoate thiolase subunit OrtA [uncultured Roseovarius sp.]|uniref:2-amino-4-oxopentanoate thiolase subunit OrtA n=1 Tax=uncultured Roseovarius sp. TaxID=293344 RepID=UPI00262D8DF6|nr:2-amino-4-oxopentanoate thiolase subunit OrtA [uncultured Roseovarius sp.]
MSDALRGDWVRIHGIVIPSSERTEQVPEDTRATSLQMWVKGHLSADANIGDVVEVKTATGRKVSGELVEVNPAYTLNFGTFQRELSEIGDQVWNLLSEGNQKND